MLTKLPPSNVVEEAFFVLSGTNGGILFLDVNGNPVSSDAPTVTAPTALLVTSDSVYLAEAEVNIFDHAGALLNTYVQSNSVACIAKHTNTLGLAYFNIGTVAADFLDENLDLITVTDPIVEAPEEGGAVAFNPSGTHVAFTVYPQEINIEGDTFFERAHIYDTSDYSKIAAILHTQSNNANTVYSLLYSEDGDNLWVGGGSGRLRRFQTTDYTEQASVAPENWFVLALAEKGDYLVQGVRTPTDMMPVRVVDKLTLSPVASLGNSVDAFIYSVVFNGDKSQMLVCGKLADDNSAIVWLFDTSNSDPTNWTFEEVDGNGLTHVVRGGFVTP